MFATKLRSCDWSSFTKSSSSFRSLTPSAPVWPVQGLPASFSRSEQPWRVVCSSCRARYSQARSPPHLGILEPPAGVDCRGEAGLEGAGQVEHQQLRPSHSNR